MAGAWGISKLHLGRLDCCLNLVQFDLHFKQATVAELISKHAELSLFSLVMTQAKWSKLFKLCSSELELVGDLERVHNKVHST